MRILKMLLILGVVALLVGGLQPVQAKSSEPDFYNASNKLLLGRFTDELYNQHKLQVADEIFTQNVVLHQAGATDTSGLMALKIVLESKFAASPDTRITSVIAQLAEGPFAGAAYFGEATRLDTGKRVQYNATVLIRVENGKIAEMWQMWDSLNVFQQTNALPTRSTLNPTSLPLWAYLTEFQQLLAPPIPPNLPVIRPWEIRHGTTDMLSTDIKAMVADLLTGFPKVVRMDCIANTIVLHQPPSVNPDPVDLAGFVNWFKQSVTDYPDMQVKGPAGQSAPVVVVDGDVAMILYNLVFTFSKDLPGNPPKVANGAVITVPGLDILRIEHRQIAEWWVNLDSYTMMQRMAAPKAVK